MDKSLLLNVKKHPDYEAVIEEVLQKKFDKELMAKALKTAKSESQAEAIYVLLKLKYTLSSTCVES